MAPKFEIIDHGYTYPDYFQGCGVAFTSFDYATTGCGSNAKEAYEDAVDSIYQIHDTEEAERLKLPKRPRGINKKDKVPANANEDCYYYVSIRYSL